MSDALTDIGRDQKTSISSAGIYLKEKEFFEKPTISLAKELVKMWTEYSQLPSGYSKSPNRIMAQERVCLFEKFIADNDKTILNLLREIFGGGIVIRYGNGFIVNSSDIFEQIEMAICESTEKSIPSFRNFRIKFEVEYLGEISCATCPSFSGMCGDFCCNSKNEKELEERMGRIKKSS